MDVEALVVIVGLVVAAGTPIGTYVATLKGHKVTELQVQMAATTAQNAAAIAAETAAAANQTTREEQGRNHFRWASEKAWSTDQKTSLGGIAVLRSMFLSNDLSHEDLVALAGVLESLTSDAVDQLGDLNRRTVAKSSPSRKPVEAERQERP